MFKMPWADPLEKKLKPFQGLVALALVGIVLWTIYILVRGTAITKTAWLVWMISP